MPNLESIEAKIEAVVDTGDEIHIVAVISETHNWTITDESTIGGKQIQSWLSQPRALNSEGQPRHDIFNFMLVNETDKSAFRAGDVCPITVHRDSTKGIKEAESGRREI
ncbi:MAG: hypothetical protein ACI9R3_005805 [Verrucomicrobiales bacterium]|jgi:hypothetical protein